MGAEGQLQMTRLQFSDSRSGSGGATEAMF